MNGALLLIRWAVSWVVWLLTLPIVAIVLVSTLVASRFIDPETALLNGQALVDDIDAVISWIYTKPGGRHEQK